MSAITARRCGAEVTILEKSPIGKKNFTPEMDVVILQTLIQI